MDDSHLWCFPIRLHPVWLRLFLVKDLLMCHSFHPATRNSESPLLPYSALSWALQEVLPHDIIWWKFPPPLLDSCCVTYESLSSCEAGQTGSEGATRFIEFEEGMKTKWADFWSSSTNKSGVGAGNLARFVLSCATIASANCSMAISPKISLTARLCLGN